MELFDIVNNEIVVSSTVLAVPQIKAIWDRDRSKSKERAMKEIKYVAFMCSYKSPYKDMSEEDRKMILKRDIMKDTDWEPDEKVAEAIEIYKKMQETPLTRFLDVNLRNIDKITNFLEKMSFEGKDEIKSIKMLDSMIKANEKAGSMIKSIISLKKQVQAEMEDKNVRGSSDIGLYEIPKK
jgi:hypothetical protein